jgi:hypothetical protein
MVDGSAGSGVVRRLVDTAWSADVASAEPDDPLVRGFAEFGLPSYSPLATEDQLRDLEAWRDGLRISANSVFVDGTLLLTVMTLLEEIGPAVLTPVTLWELTAFIDAVVCFDRLYCVANPWIRMSQFNEALGEDVLTAIPDPPGGMLRRLAVQAAANGLSEMQSLRAHAGHDDVFGQEVQAVVDGWRAVLGPDLPSDGPFNINALDIGRAQMAALMGTPGRETSSGYNPLVGKSADLLDAVSSSSGDYVSGHVDVLVGATRLPRTVAARPSHLPVFLGNPGERPSLGARQQLAASATYRTYVNQGIANALALPYLPSTLRMPFRRLFVERAAEIQDELVSVAVADRAFAQQQPSSPLILPFFTSSVLQGAATRQDVWTQMARVRDQSAAFRRVRADLDRMLERSQVSPEALRVQSAIRDQALKLADIAGAAQQSASVALGVVGQTGIVPLAGALKVGVDAVRGVDRGGSWTRIWRRLFHRQEYFLAQTNSQAIALTNALPQVEQLWEIPKIGSYLQQFASATQQMGHVLRD